MYEWNVAIQKMIDWMEAHLTEPPSLLEMAEQIGYSPFYCSTQFHAIVGMTIKSYIANRRLARAALEIRDTDERILDIAVKYGFSSQEALTRAFKDAYGITPAAYRKRPIPIPLLNSQVVLFPEHYMDCKGEYVMSEIKEPMIKMEYIPEHKYIGIWDITANGYGDFFGKHDCNTVCGMIDSMSHVSHPIVTGHTAGWFYENGKRGYFYGLGVSADYDGEIPKGFEIRRMPASYYMVFYYPPFNYLEENGKVMGAVEELAWKFDPSEKGYAWNEEICQDYQRHYPEGLGYQILRPVFLT